MLSSRDFLKYSEIIYRMWFNKNSIPMPQENLFTAERRDPAVILPFIYNGVEMFATIYSDESDALLSTIRSLEVNLPVNSHISVSVKDCFDIDVFYTGVAAVSDAIAQMPVSKGMINIVQSLIRYDKQNATVDLLYINPDFTSDDLSNMMTVIALSLGEEIHTRHGTH